MKPERSRLGRAASALTVAALALVWPLVAAGEVTGPWVEPGAVLPAGTQSALVLRTDEPILAGPTTGAPRIGSGARGARLPVFAAASGAGCQGPFVRIGPRGWVCSDHLELSELEPIAATLKTVTLTPDGLPYGYYFVGQNGSFAYRELEEADLGTPAFQLDPGFAVAVVEERVARGERYGRTGNDLWLPMRDLGPSRPSAFQGSPVEPDTTEQIPFGWVVSSAAPVYRHRGFFQPIGESIAQYVRIDILGEKGTFFRVGDDRYVEQRHVRRPTLAPPPAEVDVASGERWIDIELASQTLVAYEGDRPAFATLVATGKGRQGASNATPIGVHRIWVKLLTSNMDNLEDEHARRFYRMETVPWVQYFSKGVGLHGVFWHRSFGNVRSHGCVNLAPIDAQRLFWFTSPRLPAGWTAVLPIEREPGAVIRVR